MIDYNIIIPSNAKAWGARNLRFDRELVDICLSIWTGKGPSVLHWPESVFLLAFKASAVKTAVKQKEKA